MKVLIKVVIIVFLLCFADLSFAACTVSTTSMSFPNYNVLLLIPTDSTGSITIACNEVPPPKATVSMGQSSVSGGFNPRQVRQVFGADLMDYNLYIDATYTGIWGDGAGGGVTQQVKVHRNKPPVVLTVYGRIPPGQSVGAGTYSDSVIITVEW